MHKHRERLNEVIKRVGSGLPRRRLMLVWDNTAEPRNCLRMIGCGGGEKTENCETLSTCQSRICMFVISYAVKLAP